MYYRGQESVTASSNTHVIEAAAEILMVRTICILSCELLINFSFLRLTVTDLLFMNVRKKFPGLGWSSGFGPYEEKLCRQSHMHNPCHSDSGCTPAKTSGKVFRATDLLPIKWLLFFSSPYYIRTSGGKTKEPQQGFIHGKLQLGGNSNPVPVWSWSVAVIQLEH